MEYLQIFPETLEALEELDDAQLGRMLRAMTVYATTGQEPAFEKGTPERMLWKSMKQRVDAAVRKSELNAANRKRTNRNESQRNETERNEPQRNETERNEPQRNETNRNPESESEPETEAESEPEGDGHTQENGQQAQPRARAREGWFDPERPEADCDNAWRTERGRAAVAQRILDHAMRKLRPCNTVTETGGVLGEHVYEALVAAMASGAPPGTCTHLMQGLTTTWSYELALKREAIQRLGDVPPEWRREVDELAEELRPPEGRGRLVC